MKRFLCFTLLSMFFLSGEIKATEPIRFGIIAGINNSKFASGGINTIIGFHAGLKTEYHFSSVDKGIYIDAAALISLKGGKFSAWEGQSRKYNPYYIEVPIHIGYKLALNDRFSFLGNIGPYLGYGIMGNVVEVNEGVTYRSDVFSEYYFTSRFDYGLGIRIGVEMMKKIQVTAGYDLGLDQIENKNLTLSVAYMF
jgi:hypothetical protein